MIRQGAPDPARSMRADAQQNHRRILEAADQVFQREGFDAPLDLIVAAAGVGRTTFFRHFPDRQALLVQLLERSVDEVHEQAELNRDRDDGLLQILAFMADRIGMRAALVEYWNAADPSHPAVQAAFARTGMIFADVIARATGAGLCRPDLTATDIAMMARMIAAAVHGAPADDKASAARRAATLLLEGYAGTPG
ncbi:helix-turn-helix domain-containing protein [Sphingomonas sp. HF-S3]|uniref:Helix-turn-helix domain-containing protein n=1 Tax=Sphingomonas rustica TaxID=3103142 RepID=A0ABV0BDR4_9SPHN